MTEDAYEHPSKIDLDSEVIRCMRAENQYAIYFGINGSTPLLEALSGESITERFLQIRDNLFPKQQEVFSENRTSETGTGARHLFGRDFAVSNHWIPPVESAAQEFFPKYNKLIDEIQEEIGTSDSKDVAVRLASVVYSLGVMIHPADNANGQTFRLLALSYIHEHAPELRNRYFPIKFSDLLWTEQFDMLEDLTPMRYLELRLKPALGEKYIRGIFQEENMQRLKKYITTGEKVEFNIVTPPQTDGDKYIEDYMANVVAIGIRIERMLADDKMSLKEAIDKQIAHAKLYREKYADFVDSVSKNNAEAYQVLGGFMGWRNAAYQPYSLWYPHVENVFSRLDTIIAKKQAGVPILDAVK